VHWAASDGVKWIDSCPRIDIENAPEKITIKGAQLHKEGEAGFR
jgi:trehalose utilization protein